VLKRHEREYRLSGREMQAIQEVIDAAFGVITMGMAASQPAVHKAERLLTCGRTEPIAREIVA